MSKPIRPGDLVMVVKPAPCCGSSVGIGRVFVAGAIEVSSARCNGCGDRSRVLTTEIEYGLLCEVSRLKRLDPDALKDDVPTRDEVTA